MMYQKVLLKNLLMRSCSKDGAPAHTSKIMKAWFNYVDMKTIPDFPGYSPDLSPIENLWAMLKARWREVVSQLYKS